ncbi:conjugal transfer protein TraN [Shewanella sp. SG44-6]|jgi:conjugal transfer mating pair stabilization protein TraN|uniref:conjugal transfer protein TraN n=1 Tax=Shewanella sp. SG44-6 TaxID=2760959 RepID=UPI0016029EC7|nr:conjugal transfer protein TraN [Shewanella sp. SG44-6]MBB1389485.1 conjugal transfer protein TraN [Shewanella sp. SG44-6]
MTTNVIEPVSTVKKSVTYSVILMYLFNLLTISFVVYLATRSFDLEAAITMPVPLEYSCPTGMSLNNGVCIKKQQKPTNFSCLTPGFVLTNMNGKAICKKVETRNSINLCPNDGTNWIDIQRPWNFTDPAYPQSCSARQSASSIASCNAQYKDAFSNGVCFKLKTPLGKTCPNDGGAVETIELSCPQSYQNLGLCSAGDTQTQSTPDQSWLLTNSNQSCTRSLYETAIETCDSGFQMADVGVCEKITSATPVIECPVGYFQDGSQCQFGSLPSCGVGETYKDGGCVTSAGVFTSCVAGKELDPYTNLCIASKPDVPDFDYYTQIGLDIGKSAVSAVMLPQNNAGGGYDLQANSVDPTKDSVTINLSQQDALGLDSNNGYPVSTTDTYQNQDNQSKSIKESIKRNQDYGQSTPLVGANQEETNDLQDHSAVAYLTLMDTQNLNPPQQIGSDAAFLQQGFAEMDAVRNGDGGRFFGDCSRQMVDYQEVTDGSLVKTQTSCFKPNRNNLSSCAKKRVLTPPNSLAIVGFDPSYMSYCGPSCLQVLIGSEAKESLNNKGDTCGIYHWGTQFKIGDDYNILNTTLVKMAWDDHLLLNINDQEIVRKVDGVFPGGFPNKDSSCERSKYNVLNAPQNITDLVNQNITNTNRYLKLDLDVAVGDKGAGYVALQFNFDKEITGEWTEEIIENPEGCEAALTSTDSFCTASNWVCDARLQSNLVNNNSKYINLSEAAGSGAVKTANYNDAIVMVMRRDFDPVSSTSNVSNCGLIIATTDGDTDGNNDDGLMVCQDSIGLSTHSVNDPPAVKGTKLTNVLPEKNKWTAFAFKINSDGKGATFFSSDGTKFDSYTVLNGAFDQLKLTRIAVGRGTSGNDWPKRASDPFYVGYWEVFDSPTDEEIRFQLDRVNSEYNLVNLEPLFPGDDGLTPCMVAHMEDYQCDPLKGARLPMSGGTLGYSDILNMPDSCEVLDRNSRCVFDKATCASGWLNSSTGTCFGWDISYTCETGAQVILNKSKVNDTCFSDAECIGSDCAFKADESNTDFVQTAAMYASINELDNDRACTDPSDPSTCQVFVGKKDYCSWDQFKVNDCCSLDGTDTTANLFKGSKTLFQAGQYAATAEGPFTDMFMKDNFAAKGWDMVKSGWDSATEYMSGVTDPLVESATEIATSFWDTISQPFVSSAEAVAGTTSSTIATEGGSVVTSFFDDVSAAVAAAMDSVYEYIYDVMPDVMQQAVQSAASALGAEGTNELGAESLQYVSEYLVNVLGFVMFLYTMYQLIKLVYNLLTACKEEELQMPTNLKERKCFLAKHVPCEKTLGVCTTKARNEYCCFASTLSRIIMEQAIVQIGSSPQEWHEVEQCRGFTLGELADVDFGAINFDEWIGLMVESGKFPEDLSLEKVTDEDASVNNGGRDNTIKRMEDRLPGDTGVKLRELYNSGSIETNIDCNAFPRPALCDAGVTIPNPP